VVDLEGHLDRRHRQPLSQADVLTLGLALTGIGGVLFRKTATTRIG
jgi:hypothetical protein